MAKVVSETPQTEFWRGDFGDSYMDRNVPSQEQLHARRTLWADILAHTEPTSPKSFLEVGANLGINLRALRLVSDARFFAIEPNDRARQQLINDGIVASENTRGGTAASIDLPDGIAEFAFTCGVLIHIHPDQLDRSIREIYRCSSRWIAAVEYFSDRQEMIPYRGHNDRLFKRDFGGLWLDTFPNLRIVGYGFAWKRTTGLDNLTWWLFEKR